MDKKSRITIDVAGATVVVDGRSLKCPMPVEADGYRVLQWNPAAGKWPGFAERMSGEGLAFKDWSLIKPFVSGWRSAAKADDAAQAAAAAHAAAEAARLQAEAEAARAEHEAAAEAQRRKLEDERPVIDAQNGLASTDYKIIKAMETALLASGALDVDTASEREAWREVIRKAREAV